MSRWLFVLVAALAHPAWAEPPAAPRDLGLVGCGCTGGYDCCHAEGAAPLVKTTPTFTYEEGKESLAFTAPGGVRFSRLTDGHIQTCDSTLAETKGNKWTAQDLRAAFAAPEVQAVRAGRRVFASAIAGAKISTKTSTIVWRATCAACARAPQAIEHLQEVLHGLLVNRSSDCGKSARKGAPTSP